MSIPVLHQLSALPRTGRPLCLAAGFFDGVHRGHRKVIATAVSRSRALGGQCWILSFDEHPRKLTRPGAAPLMLTCTEHKRRLFEALGVDGCLLLPFTRRLAETPPRRFLERMVRAVPDWAQIAVGADWRFGAKGEGDIRLLTAFCGEHGVKVDAVDPVFRRGAPVSSTRIRDAIGRGAVVTAADLLGRPFSVLGRVVRGGGLARGLGFPTANLQSTNEVKPADGVYACYARLEGGSWWPGVMNVGRRPTLQPVPEPVMEIHLIGFSRHIYGQEMEVFFLTRLRGERRFSSVEAMASQVRKDIRQADARLTGNRWKKACEECFTKGEAIRYSGAPKEENEV